MYIGTSVQPSHQSTTATTACPDRTPKAGVAGSNAAGVEVVGVSVALDPLVELVSDIGKAGFAKRRFRLRVYECFASHVTVPPSGVVRKAPKANV